MIEVIGSECSAFLFSETLLPLTTLNKIIPLEIRSPLLLAISCSAQMHGCTQKRKIECTGLTLTLF